MSERTNAPRSGGRVTDQRGSVPARDADAQRSDARGARHFSGANEARADRSDTRRSGIGRDSRATGDSRGTDDSRGKGEGAAGNGLVRGKGRRPEPMIKTRREEAQAARKRDGAPAEGRRRDARVGGRRPVADAPVDGTAALRIEVSAVEPSEIAEPLEIVEAQPLTLSAPVKNTGAAGPRLRVAPPAPVSAPRAPFVASVIGVVIVGVLGILLINTKTNENSFRIADLQKQDAVLDNQQQDLDNQLVQASSIGNLDAAARRLGLVKVPDNPALITLPDGKIIGVPRPATGSPAVTAQDAKTAGASAGANASDAGAGKVVPADGQADGRVQNGTNGAGTTTGTAATGTNGAPANGATTGDGSQMNGGTTSGTGTGR